MAIDARKLADFLLKEERKGEKECGQGAEVASCLRFRQFNNPRAGTGFDSQIYTD